MTSSTLHTTEDDVNLAGKYLTLALGTEQYAIDILQVVEIFGVRNITKVPRCPDHIKGVINLRGKIIPVVDLRIKFQLEEKPYDARTCVVVINTQLGASMITVGIIVDTVLEVRDFPASDIAAPPHSGTNRGESYVVGMGKFNESGVAIIIDIKKVFSKEDADFLKENTEARS